MQKIVVNHASGAKLPKPCVKQNHVSLFFLSLYLAQILKTCPLWWHCKCRLRATTTFLLYHSYALAASSVGTLSSTKFELSRNDSCGLKLFCSAKPTNWNWESHKLSDYFIWTLTRLRNKDTMCDGSDPVYRTHMRGTGQRRKLHIHCIALFYYYMYLKLFLVFI